MKLLPAVRVDPDVVIIRQHSLAFIQVVKDQAFKPLQFRIPKPQPFPVDRFFLAPDCVFDLAFDLLHLEHPVFPKVLSKD